MKMKNFGLSMFIFLIGIFITANTLAQSTPSPEILSVEQNADSVTTPVSEADPIDKIVEKAINAKIGSLDSDESNTTGFVGTVLFLVIALPVLITFGAIVLIVYFSTKHKKEREKARYDLYLKSLEAGHTLPENFFEEPVKQSSNLKKGAIWLAVGLGVMIFGLFEVDNSLMGMGAIPAFIGAAYLLVYFIERKNNNDTPAVNE
jgi:hypothetical protein